jgi:hypothetical protein
MDKLYKKEQKMIRRKNYLIKRLKNKGLEFREDSKLCEKYINFNKNIKLKFVIQRMMEMKYIYEYCHIKDFFAEAEQNIIDELEEGFIPDRTVFQEAEALALDKYSNGKYPEKFPWFTTT